MAKSAKYRVVLTMVVGALNGKKQTVVHVSVYNRRFSANYLLAFKLLNEFCYDTGDNN